MTKARDPSADFMATHGLSQKRMEEINDLLEGLDLGESSGAESLPLECSTEAPAAKHYRRENEPDLTTIMLSENAEPTKHYLTKNEPNFTTIMLSEKNRADVANVIATEGEVRSEGVSEERSEECNPGEFRSPNFSIPRLINIIGNGLEDKHKIGTEDESETLPTSVSILRNGSPRRRGKDPLFRNLPLPVRLGHQVQGILNMTSKTGFRFYDVSVSIGHNGCGTKMSSKIATEAQQRLKTLEALRKQHKVDLADLGLPCSFIIFTTGTDNLLNLQILSTLPETRANIRLLKKRIAKSFGEHVRYRVRTKPITTSDGFSALASHLGVIPLDDE